MSSIDVKHSRLIAANQASSFDATNGNSESNSGCKCTTSSDWQNNWKIVFSALLTSQTNLQAIGVNASSCANLITIRSVSQNITTYSISQNTGASEILTQGVTLNGTQNALISGTPATGDVLTITVSDVGLSGGTLDVPYTVSSGESPTTIATGIAALINSSMSLQTIGVTATSAGPIVALSSTSTNSTTYSQSVSSGSAATITLTATINGVVTCAVNGTSTSGDSLAIQIVDAGLTGGSQTVSYSVSGADTPSTIAAGISSAVNSNSALQVIGVTASSNSNVVNLKSISANATTCASSVSSGATESLVLGTGVGALQSVYNSVNELVAQAPGGPTKFTGTANKPLTNINAKTNVLSIAAKQFSSSVTGTVSPNGQEQFNFGWSQGKRTLIIGGNAASGDVITLTIENPNLPGGEQAISYAATSSSVETMSQQLTALINANTNLQVIGFTASTLGVAGNVWINSFTDTFSNHSSYTTSTSTGATEVASVVVSANGSADISINGKATAGDTITVNVSNPGLPSGMVSKSYSVTSTDTLSTVAAGIASLMTSDSNLQAIGLSASNQTNGKLISSERFVVSSNIAPAQNSLAITGTDGSGNTKTNNFLVSTNAGSSNQLMYDLNGNLTSDGTNTYQWDAENRLIQIIYPGSGNNSQLAYDGEGQCISITENTSGITQSTKLFVWEAGIKREARDASSNLIAQFFDRGEFVNGSPFYYTKDRDDFSIRELVDGTGTVQSQYQYDPYGRAIQVQGTLNSDFQYASYYFHTRSGLNMTANRLYNAKLGRWLNRDLLENAEMSQGGNLYAYVVNDPVGSNDPSGLAYFALRKLGTLHFWFPGFSKNGFLHNHGLELSHELVVFEDDKLPSTVGYDRPGLVENEKVTASYRRIGGKYNDCVMRKAVKAPDLDWSGPGNYNFVAHNCHDWAAAVRQKYATLLQDPQTLDDCFPSGDSCHK